MSNYSRKTTQIESNVCTRNYWIIIILYFYQREIRSTNIHLLLTGNKKLIPWQRVKTYRSGSVLFAIMMSTKNASLIITDFLAMIYKNEQPRTASLCRGWGMLENDFNLICRRRVIPMTSYRLNVHMMALCIDRL